MIPFLALGGGAAALAFIFDKRTRLADATEARKTEAAAKTEAASEQPISTSLKFDDLKVELGYSLLPLVNSPDGTDRLTEQIKALRRSLAVEMGFVMPAVRILDNVQLDANAYVIKIKEVEAGSGKVWAGQYMVMDPAGGQVKLPGTHTAEPTFGLPATWVDAAASTQVAGSPKVGSAVWVPGSFTWPPAGSMTMYWPAQTLPLPASTSLILMT